MNYDVFISYSRKDTVFADRICRSFDKSGISYFIDRQDIAIDPPFEVLPKAITDCKLFLFLGSRNTYTAKYAPKEINYAVNNVPRNRIIPYLIDDEKLPPELDFLLSDINQLKMKECPIESGLVSAIKRILFNEHVRIKNTVNSASAEEYYQKALRYLKYSKIESAIKYFKRASEVGVHAEAEFELANIYQKGGKGIERDMQEAKRWFQLAAAHGHHIASQRLIYLAHIGY